MAQSEGYKGDFSFSQPTGRSDRERNSKAQALNLAKSVVQTNNQAKQNQEDALKNEIARLSNLAQQTAFYSSMSQYKSDIDAKLKEVQSLQDLLKSNVEKTNSNTSALPPLGGQPMAGLPIGAPPMGDPGLPPLPIGPPPGDLGMPNSAPPDMGGGLPPEVGQPAGKVPPPKM